MPKNLGMPFNFDFFAAIATDESNKSRNAEKSKPRQTLNVPNFFSTKLCIQK